MRNEAKNRRTFLFIAIITGISVILIITNALLGMIIPFRVEFLLGYVGALLIFVVWHAVYTKGWRNSLLMFVLSFVIAFSAEALGVNFGLIFGRYYYTEVLGIQWLGVPFLAALTWEPIIYASFALTDVLFDHFSSTEKSWFKQFLVNAGLAAVGALATTAWDLMIDPIAVSNHWWVWVDGGEYMPVISGGIPLTNYLGWLGVAFTVNLVYRYLSHIKQEAHQSTSLMVDGPLMLYTSLFLTSFGVAITILRQPIVGFIGTMAMGSILIIAWGYKWSRARIPDKQ